MKNNIQHIWAAPNWWLEIRFSGETKIVRRLPIAAWTLVSKGNLKAICFDGEQAFLAESDDELEISYRYGSNLKQIGDGIPLDDEKPKRRRMRGK